MFKKYKIIFLKIGKRVKCKRCSKKILLYQIILIWFLFQPK